MDFLLELHSGVRWLVILAALVALVVSSLAWAGRSSNGVLDRRAMMAFVGLMDLQMLLGIILLVTRGMAQFRIEHGVTMLIAVALGHLAARWRRSPAPIRGRNNVLMIVAVLLLIGAGISRLPQGWFG